MEVVEYTITGNTHKLHTEHWFDKYVFVGELEFIKCLTQPHYETITCNPQKVFFSLLEFNASVVV